MNLHSVDTTKKAVVYEDRSLVVETIPLQHRVPTCGYLFREKEGCRHIDREMMNCYNIPISQINNIKAGADWTDEDGEIIPNKKLTKPADKARSYAYCSDTKYIPNLYKSLENVDVLYHESTYAKDNEGRARMYYHSTAEQAAHVAKDAGVGKLLLGHFSARYENESSLLDEAKSIFANSFLTNEGMVFDV
jgi:ribonuclease Z